MRSTDFANLSSLVFTQSNASVESFADLVLSSVADVSSLTASVCCWVAELSDEPDDPDETDVLCVSW